MGIDLDNLNRAQLDGVPRALANALDDWLFAQHGVTAGAHNVGAFLDDLAHQGLTVDQARAVPPASTRTPDLGTINATRNPDGTVTAEHVGNPVTCMSLGLLAQHDPALVHVKDGRVTVGDLVYRVIGFEVPPSGAAAALEGGMLVLELVTS
jgi:hypothetical protein